MADPQFSLSQNAAVPDANRITYFGVTDTRGKHVPFGIKREDRYRHAYVIGKTGMGKSTLLENMAIQDIQNGEGLCFIDPHGGTAEKLLEYIPEHRVKDVLYFAPFDLQYPVSFNVLENVDADKRHFVVAGLMSTFEKIWVDAWSARMAYILQNTIAALLEFPGATLLGVNRMYIDKEYRKNVLTHVTDPSTRSFWVDEYSKYTDRYAQEATPAIQNKIGQFAANALVRNIIGQEQSAFNIRELMDTRKIFIANLSKGRMGEGNANLLGSMLITKIYLAAMSRADVAPSLMRDLPPFFLYVDEFQNFANRSFADILSEARKYKLALTVAHQYIEQMEDEVRAAVFGNVGTMMTFRVGSYDAEVLEKEFAPVFTADDLVNLGRFQLYLKLMIDGVSSQPFSASAMPPIEEPTISHRDRAIAYSRAQYSRPRAEVEQAISDWTAKKYEDPEADAKEAARQERRATRDAEEGRPPRERMPGGTWSNDRERMPRRDAPPRQVRETRVDRPPLPERGSFTPARQVREGDRPQQPPAPRALPPRPAPIRKEQNREDLRATLAKISSAQVPKPQPVASVAAKTDEITTQAVAAVKPPLQPTTYPVRGQIIQREDNLQPKKGDDGKSITEEGKQELRNLLANLTGPRTEKNTSIPTSINTSIPPKEVETLQNKAASSPSTPQTTEGTTVPTVPATSAPAATQKRAPAPVGLPPEKLKAMLHVEKPDIG